MAKDDPLATQVWRMYARQKATLPHAQRMENLTWRMMALALKKKKEDEEVPFVNTTPKGEKKGAYITSHCARTTQQYADGMGEQT